MQKKSKDVFVTFIVFSSARVILTGRYEQNMKEQYEFFVKTANEHRHEIEEIIRKPIISINEYLENIKLK